MATVRFLRAFRTVLKFLELRFSHLASRVSRMAYRVLRIAKRVLRILFCVILYCASNDGKLPGSDPFKQYQGMFVLAI